MNDRHRFTGTYTVAGVLAFAALGFAGSATVGCERSKEPAPTLAPSASALAVATAQPGSQTVKYTVDPASKTSIDMPAPKEHIRADTTAARGTLLVDLGKLSETRGTVEVDLTTLATHTFGDDKDASQTAHARTWLEVGEAVSEDVRNKNKWVGYAIKSVEDVSAPDLSKVAPVAEGADRVRTVTMKVKGEFLLHGHKADKDCPIEVKFHYPAGTDPIPLDAKPTSIEVKAKSPLHVTLKEHDVKPRDAFGKFAQDKLSLFGTKVAEEANISFAFRATPAP